MQFNLKHSFSDIETLKVVPSIKNITLTIKKLYTQKYTWLLEKKLLLFLPFKKRSKHFFRISLLKMYKLYLFLF